MTTLPDIPRLYTALAEVPGNMFLNVDNTISISLLKNNRI